MCRPVPFHFMPKPKQDNATFIAYRIAFEKKACMKKISRAVHRSWTIKQHEDGRWTLYKHKGQLPFGREFSRDEVREERRLRIDTELKVIERAVDDLYRMGIRCLPREFGD